MASSAFKCKDFKKSAKDFSSFYLNSIWISLIFVSIYFFSVFLFYYLFTLQRLSVIFFRYKGDGDSIKLLFP
jgi:hypothetical protein